MQIPEVLTPFSGDVDPNSGSIDPLERFKKITKAKIEIEIVLFWHIQ